MSLRQKPDLSTLHLGWKAAALEALQIESQGLVQLIAAMDGPLGEAVSQAVEVIRTATGRVVLSGMGKSGHSARKIAATLSSTGTPAQFVHPADASHGDLGMITRDDVVVIVSASGESVELQDIINHARRFGVTLIAITAKQDSSLAAEADIALVLPAVAEACPIGLAPTTTTLLQQALGDALAIALLKDKGFSAVDFRSFHPGGKLGAQLKQVKQVMHTAERLPLGGLATPMDEAIVIMTRCSFGCLGVVGDDDRLAGIITDGDLRRHMGGGLLAKTAADIMTTNPKTVMPTALVSEALEVLNSAKITSLFVIDDRKRPIGLIHIHDLLRIGAA